MDEYNKLIQHLKLESISEDVNRLTAALRDAIQLIEKLDDERKSLWQLLDELKASEIEHHSKLLKDEIQAKIDEVRALVSSEVGEA